MIAFEVEDMTCGQCAATITKAVHALDADARVEIDLAGHRVAIQAADVSAQQLAQVIREAGYTPVATQAQTVDRGTKKQAACCCR